MAAKLVTGAKSFVFVNVYGLHARSVLQHSPMSSVTNSHIVIAGDVNW